MRPEFKLIVEGRSWVGDAARSFIVVFKLVHEARTYTNRRGLTLGESEEVLVA